ncbi:MAG TPA: hypothetical protein PK079_23215 [Leptospiraceae bacterium]|nr:hypothetical protein [Leptospiraceae bacterium]HMW06352.1 hypothetical protein [Leptospiraceae bacterium]HMX30969.1 hypothetical protein [Leptospiraceae bacterium]HMY34305.1 hypothetical protein [Leptospiraceae bacterium]HMZ63787.1 hypothetical protein [Leptospiraceae bacterium]
MSVEVILLAIGCYLFCGINDKIHLMKTGDWREGGNYTNLEETIQKLTLAPNETSYEWIIEKIGKNFARQRTHRVIRKQKYNGIVYYFNKELRYINRTGHNYENSVAYVSCTNDLELNLFFRDNLLVFYNIHDSRMDRNCNESFGPLHTIQDKSWLGGGENDASSPNSCNEKFYRIFTLDKK